MGNKYPVLVRDSRGLQLYSGDWAVSDNDYEAKIKMDYHYDRYAYEYLGLLKTDIKLIRVDYSKTTFKKRLKWFFCSIKRAFKANILIGQQYEVHTDF